MGLLVVMMLCIGTALAGYPQPYTDYHKPKDVGYRADYYRPNAAYNNNLRPGYLNKASYPAYQPAVPAYRPAGDYGYAKQYDYQPAYQPTYPAPTGTVYNKDYQPNYYKQDNKPDYYGGYDKGYNPAGYYRNERPYYGKDYQPNYYAGAGGAGGYNKYPTNNYYPNANTGYVKKPVVAKKPTATFPNFADFPKFGFTGKFPSFGSLKF